MSIENQIECLPPETQNALRDKAGQNLDALAAIALENDSVLDVLVACLSEKDEVLRYNAVRALERLAAQNPERLYPAWATLTALLDSPNGYHRAGGTALLAAVLPADTGHRFDTLFERYLSLFDDPKVMVARYLIQYIGSVVAARPDLATHVTARLLALDSTHHTPDRKDLLRGDILEAFEQFLPETTPNDQAAILNFARAAQDCSSPRTRKIARKFILAHTE